jgi:hypothetical protein
MILALQAARTVSLLPRMSSVTVTSRCCSDDGDNDGVPAGDVFPFISVEKIHECKKSQISGIHFSSAQKRFPMHGTVYLLLKRLFSSV